MLKDSVVTTGIDFGEKSLKIVRMLVAPTGPKILAHGILSSNSEAELKGFFKENKINKTSVRVSLKSKYYKVKDIELPRIPDEEIAEAVKWQLRDSLEGDPDDYYYQHIKLPEAYAPSQDKQAMFVFAVKNEILKERQEFFKSLGLNCEILEPDVSGARFAFFQNVGKDVSATYAFMEMGYQSSYFAVFKERDFLFYRDIPAISGQAVTKTISKDLNISINEAEECKLTYKIGEGDDQKMAKVGTSISNFLSKISIEIQRSLDAYSLTTKDVASDVKGLYISGGATYLYGFEEYLKRTLGLTIERFNPFKGIDKSEISAGSLANKEAFYVIACGLAL